MKMRRVVLVVALLAVTGSPAAQAQEEIPDHSITYRGLSGLFNVISVDTIEGGQVSFGLVHRNYDRELNDIDMNDLAAAFGLGITDRLEIGLSYQVNRQPDFDDLYSGAFYNRFPRGVPTIDNGTGDMYLGMKVALARLESRAFGLSLFGQVKLPLGDEEQGRGTGGWDYTVGTAVGAAGGPVGVHGNVSYTFVGDARLDGAAGEFDLDLADVVDWGVGLELATRSPVKAIVELSGEYFVNEKTNFLVDGFERDQDDATDLTVGFKLGGAGHSGFTFSAAYVRNLTMDDERADGGDTDPNGIVAEVTFTSSERVVPPPPPPPPLVAMNRPPTCTLTSSLSELYPLASDKAHSTNLAVQASDPDGDTLSYTWSASGGTVTGSGASVSWQPPAGVEEGRYTVTVRVTDGKGGEATCGADLAVKADPEYFAGRVQFEFDRYDLSAEAKTVLDRAAAHLGKFPNLRLTVEGHTCYIATEEYNLQLGQQRAEAIRGYLLGLGVDANRLATISYGETRPWQDNAREITRRLNRRGEFRFRFSE